MENFIFCAVIFTASFEILLSFMKNEFARFCKGITKLQKKFGR